VEVLVEARGFQDSRRRGAFAVQPGRDASVSQLPLVSDTRPVEIRGGERTVWPQTPCRPPRRPVLVLVQRCQIGGQRSRAAWERSRRVYRRRSCCAPHGRRSPIPSAPMRPRPRPQRGS
jgi:hypothetical protein